MALSKSNRAVLIASVVWTVGALFVRTAHAESVPLKSEHGTLVLPVIINDRITLDFVLDSGASDVSIPVDVFSTLRRTGTIVAADLLPEATYRLADGSVQQAVRFRIRSLKAGSFELRDVVASVAPAQAELLLGQSFLRRLHSWSIDNELRVLIINGQVGDAETHASRTSTQVVVPAKYIGPKRSAGPSSAAIQTTLSRAPPPPTQEVRRWMICTPAQLRADECNDTAAPQRIAAHPRNDEPTPQPEVVKRPSPDDPRWTRCTPAQLRADECK